MAGSDRGALRSRNDNARREERVPMMEVQEQGGGTLRLIGELDAATAPQLQRRLEEHGGVTQLDLHDVTFIDSSGLRVLLLAARVCSVGELTLLRPSAHVLRILEMTGLIESFRIRPTPG